MGCGRWDGASRERSGGWKRCSIEPSGSVADYFLFPPTAPLLGRQEADGNLLGLSGQVRLPAFRQVAPYRSGDGQVEVDALAEGEERWAVEVKWRGRLAGGKEVQKLLAAAGTLSARLWFIWRAGFTPEAEVFARREKIMIPKRPQQRLRHHAPRGADDHGLHGAALIAAVDTNFARNGGATFVKFADSCCS